MPANYEPRFDPRNFALRGSIKLDVHRKRTQSGCLASRKLHYKRGEERPFCQNCIKSGRECEDYSQRVIYKQSTLESATVESATDVCSDTRDHPSALVDRVKDSGMDVVEFLLEHWTTQNESMP